MTSVMTSDCPCPSQRQFQDKSYFLGALRTKMSDLTSEIARLGREVDTQQREQSTYLAYDKVGGCYSVTCMTTDCSADIAPDPGSTRSYIVN